MHEADLVLEGGGIKGIGLVGALDGLCSDGDPYRFHRVAGTSAGAIVASLLAAGFAVPELKKIMMDQDFRQFEDESRVFRHFKITGEAFGLLFHEGMFRGDYLHDWVASLLEEKGIRTWRDLKDDDPGSALPPAQRYKLVVIVSDISRGRMLRLPWDYRDLLGVDPDTQSVAEAVRASASIPFFFRPFHMPANPGVTGGHGEILCTDGGMLSNFPVDIFDRRTWGSDDPPRWPTLGIKLSAQRPVEDANWDPNANAFELAKSLLSTMSSAHDLMHIDDPEYASRTIFVDTTGFKSTDFAGIEHRKPELFERGQKATASFLQTWNWEEWRDEPRPLPRGWRCTGPPA